MGELNVLYAFNDKYAPFAGVSILSLLMNNKSMDRIRLFCVIDSVSKENIDKLRITVADFAREIVLIDATDVNNILEKLGVPQYRGSYATHYRKFFHLFLPEDVHRLLYIDSDSIVPGDLSDLATKDFMEKCVMVSLDTLGQRYKELLGFQPEETYFNAGVTFIDVDAWKERKYAERLIDHITNIRSSYCNPDQDLFNLVVKDDTLTIGPEYNFQPVHRVYSDKLYFRNYPRIGYYSSEEIEYARQNPKIIHAYRYMGEFPWHKGNVHPDNDIFDSYLERSLWSDYEKKRAKKGIIIAIEKAMYIVLPKCVFLPFFKVALYNSFKRKNRLLMECQNG